MANHHHHLPKWAVNTLKFTRAWERTAERHWPMAAYAVLSLAAAGYVVQQLAHVIS